MNIKRYACAIGKYLSDSNYRFLMNAGFGKYNNLSDKEYLERKFECCMGKTLDLDSPQTFNEKLQWLKLYDRKSEYTVMVDKYKVREYIKNKIGEEYLIPLIGIWDNPDDIDFDALPDKFVLKCNHNSGLGMCICKDKSNLDIKKVKNELRKGLAQDYYLTGREWPYKNVPRRIIAEKYMEDATVKELRDYKIYTFNGKAKFCMINTDRGTDTRADYFDESYNWMDFTWGYPHTDVKPQKPVNYEKMFQLAENLAKGTATLRVDFYEVNGQVYFGELTFFDASGFDKIIPESYDLKFGKWIQLPDKNG